MRVLLLLLSCPFLLAHEETLSKVDTTKYTVAKEKRYLIYDVNHGEGFNLRRDVYLRVANTVRLLREKGENFHLVLPPWGGLYHWDRQEVKQPWSMFFDIQAMSEFVPVIEFEDYLEETNNAAIDQVVYLQHFMEGWGDNFVYKYEDRKCNDEHNGYKKVGKLWKGWFFSYSEVRTKAFKCISFQGDSSTLAEMISKEFSTLTSIFVDRAETALHQDFGQQFYWKARRSMRYAPHLIEIANEFRKDNLDSNDEKDKTFLPKSWQEERPSRAAIGGDYVCAHWRRRDFVRAHFKELPSINGTALILNKMGKKYKTSKVFLATDAKESEVIELEKNTNFPIVRFSDPLLTDGEIAILDQIICSRARYFTGSHVSTFSFRIQEDREILGFPEETTFNRMCPDELNTCGQPGKWYIVY